MATERTGLHTTFHRLDRVKDEYEEIASVVTISPPQVARETVDVEELNPEDDIKRKLIGLIDAGEMTLVVNFDPEDDTQMLLSEDLEAGEEEGYRIQFPLPEPEEGEDNGETEYEGGYYDIIGIVTGFAPQEIAAGSVVQAEITIAITAKTEYEEITESEPE